MKNLITGFASAFLGISAFAAEVPKFTLAWSEYPSWSAFDVAQTVGIIGKNDGEQSLIEKRWGVKIVLKFMDYDPCIQSYSTNDTDAVCITNIDVLSPSLGRKSVAIIPTSTSYGGDALIVPSEVVVIDDLKNTKVYGLSKSVSEYAFASILQNQGAENFNISFVNMDPGAAATAIQTGDKNVRSIMVWNPYVLDTIRKTNGKTRVLADSRSIPLEIIDMVVVGEDVLRRPGGENFARALADVYYAINERLNDPSTRDDTLIAIGEKFSNLGLSDMRKVVDQTRFFGTPAIGVDLFSNKPVSIGGSPITTLKQIMSDRVIPRSVALGIVDEKVTISYGAQNANLRFDPQYMASVYKYHQNTVSEPVVNK